MEAHLVPDRPMGRLVVVDDEPVILDVLSSVLEGQDWQVVTASTGRAAIEAMAEGVDVLLTDKNLPDIQGLELIAHARAVTPDVEIIILTGYASLDSAVAALKLGVFDFIVKPPRDIFEVAHRVRAAFERQAMRRENGRLVEDLESKNSALLGTLEELRSAQAEVIQSEKLAGIGTLAAGVAHEVSSPLFGILGLAEAIEDEETLDGARAHARDIVRYSMAIKDIVVGLTRYARQAQTDPMESMELGPAVDRAIRLVGHAQGPSAAALETPLEEGVWVRARSSELQQVVVNLVRNASEAAGHGGWVRVRGYRDAAWAVLVVEDSGSGIAEEHLPQVFDPFFTTKAPGQGTGLGLHVVYRLVSSHRGSIVASNHEDGGARFEVRLPVGVAP